MAVVKATIKAALLALYARAKTEELTDDQYADAEADIIRNAVISATVNTGISVQVNTGTGTGATIGTGTVS